MDLELSSRKNLQFKSRNDSEESIMAGNSPPVNVCRFMFFSKYLSSVFVIYLSQYVSYLCEVFKVCFVSFSINICHIVGEYFIFCICEIFVSIEVYSGLQCFSWGSRSQTPSPENHSSHFETIMSSSKISHHPHQGEFCILDKKWEDKMSLQKFPVSKTKSIASALIPLGRRKKHNLSPSLPPHPALYCFYGIFWLNNCTESVGFLPCFEVSKHSIV